MAKSSFNIPVNPNAFTTPALTETFKKSGLEEPSAMLEGESQPSTGYQEGQPQEEEGQDWSAVMENRQPGPQVYPDLDSSAYNQTSVDLQGNLISPGDLALKRERDRHREMEILGVHDLSFDDRESIQNQFGSAIGEKDIVAFKLGAVRMGEALGGMTISGDTNSPIEMAGKSESALEYIKRGYGLTALEAVNNTATTAALILPVVAGNETISIEQDGTSPNEVSLQSFLGGEFNVSHAEKETKLKTDTVKALLGSTYAKLAKLSKNRTDEQGRPIDPRSLEAVTADQQVTGEALLASFEESGILVSNMDPDGVERTYVNPLYGDELYKATRELSRTFSQAGLGRSQTTPGTDKGESGTAQAITRHGDVKSKQKVDEIVESKRILNQTPLITSPTRAWLAGMLFSEAYKSVVAQDAAALPDAAPALNMEMDPPPREPSKYKQYKAEMGQKFSKGQKTIQGFSEHLKVGSPRFNVWWEDYIVHRLYCDSNDANMQRDLVGRAVIGAIEVPFTVSGVAYHKTGVSRATADKFWSDVGKLVREEGRESYHLENDNDRELGFLLTTAHALDVGKSVGKSTKTLHPSDWLTLMTPEFIARSASFGSKLQSLIPASTRDVAVQLQSPENINVTSEQRVILQQLLDNSDKKDWGFKAQAYIDLARYVDAKNRGVVFTPRLTTAIDQNSAGRAFAGVDVGSDDVARRVGLAWQRYYDKGMQDALPYGSPRTYFLGVATDIGVDKAIGKATPHDATVLKEILRRYAAADTTNKFVDDFGKKVLLTSDYGKSVLFHFEEAKAFLRKHPEFAAEYKALFPKDEAKAVATLNEIFKHTLYEATAVWQQAVPKNITKVLHMMDRSPAPIGFFGEPMGVGSFIMQKTGKSIKIQGKDIDKVIELEKRVRSIRAKAKDKGYLDEEGRPIDAPGEGTADINQIGPMMGQYRESALVITTMLHLNKGRGSDKILFAQPVFDNFVLNSGSFAQFLYTANNVIAPKVFGWDIQVSFIDDFMKQMNVAIKQVEKDGKADIGTAGKYYGATMTLDREYGYLANSEVKLSPKKQALLDFLNSPSSGYVPPSESRPDSIVISAEKYKNLITKFFNYSLYTYDKHGRVQSSISKWRDEGLAKKKQIMKEIMELAARGDILFMT